MKPSFFVLMLGIYACALPTGCESKPSARTDEETKAVASARPGTSAKPEVVPAVSKEEMERVLNPGKEPVYSGPIGTVKGVVRATGDEPPVLDGVIEQIPDKCGRARRMYGKLFREGPGRALADVLVAVTEHAAYIPPQSRVEKVVAKGCAFESRTIALTFGQHIEVKNRDGETYIPQLRGAKTHALMVAIPGGDPVSLFPSKVGRYELVDQVHSHAKADVFVLKYATMDVTGLDGRYEISGLPAREVKVSAYLPATGQTVEKKVQIKSGEPTELNFEIPFDASKHTAPEAP